MLRGLRSSAFSGDVVFPDFPTHGVWRLAGFEAVRDAPQQPLERQVRFVFRQIVDGALTDVTVRPFGPSGWLPYTLIGSEWRLGRRVSTAPDGLEDWRETIDVSAALLTDVHVFQRNATAVDATGRPLSPHYLVPPFVHGFQGVTADHFRLVAIPHNGDPYGVLVPAYVLIQFYMATSTPLAQAAFTGGFERLYNPAETRFTDAAAGVFRIRLSPGVPLDDAWVLARYAACPADGPARRAMNRVWSSLTRAAVNEQPRLPAALFPFDGETRLTARGLWLPGDPHGGPVSPRRFLILQIHRCTGPFPYNDLEVLVDSADPSGPPQGEGPTIPVATSPRPKTLSMVSNRRAETNRPMITIPVPPAVNRFARLRNKHLTLVIKERAAGPRSPFPVFVSGAPASCGATGPSTGDGTHVHPVAFEPLPDVDKPPTDPADHAPQPRARGVATFSAMLDALEASDGITAVAAIALDPPFEAVGTRTYGSIPAGEGRSWHLKTDGVTPRLLMLAGIRTAAGVTYAVDLEPKDEETTGAMMVVQANAGAALSKAALRSIVAVIRKANRTWSSGSEDRKVRQAQALLSTECSGAVFTAIGHTRSTAAEYAERVLQTLRRGALWRNTTGDAAAEPTIPAPAAGEDRR